MNVLDKELRLKELLENNIKNEEIGTAIAITGAWGIGKTFFWRNFLDKQLSDERVYKKDNVFNRKYAYVSLFGLESLSDLRTQIYSSIESYHSSIEIPKWIKSLPSIFKDTRITQLGINAPVKLIDSLMFAQVKDAIICFDDFERMSNKLDIKDVMGLANFLKLEKNCQIILILDEDKTEAENKNKYGDYKEKLVDETIILNSVEPLIRENTKGIDEKLINLMIDFAEKLEIHNFRFFQKVIKLFRHFLTKLTKDIAYSTKEIILIRILQGCLIQDFPNFEYSWDDCKYYTEQKKENWSDQKKQTYKKLNEVSDFFIKSDLWLIEFKKWFDQKDDFSNEALIKLAESDLISEEKNRIKEEFWTLCRKFWNYQCDEDFIAKFYESSIKNIGLLNLGNLNFSINILNELGAVFEAQEIDREIKLWIEKQLKINAKYFRGINSFQHGEHEFNTFIDEYLIENVDLGLPTLVDSIYAYYINQQYSKEHERVINQSSRDDWDEFIFEIYPKDERFVHSTIASIVSNLSFSQKQIIKEILDEKGKTSEFHKKYANYLISKLINEKKES